MTEFFRLLTDVTEAVEKTATIPAENVEKMWATVITGLVVVFLILVILVFILWLLGKVMNIKRKPKKEKKSETADAPAPVPVHAVEFVPQQAAEYTEEDDSEIIAVIAAAIAAFGEAEGKQYRIASVKRREKPLRSNWAAAGISENTRPF